MYCDQQINQERIEANDAARCDAEEASIQAVREMGATDAAFGHSHLPQFANEPYLEGYIAKLKELPTDADGAIIHRQPTQHFAWGYVDNPEPSRDEF